MIMNFGGAGGMRPDPSYAQAPRQANTMAQIHDTYRARIADLERELVAARQYIARLQSELAGRNQVAPIPAPQSQPAAPQIDPSVRAFYGDHLGCEHPYDLSNDEQED